LPRGEISRAVLTVRCRCRYVQHGTDTETCTPRKAVEEVERHPFEEERHTSTCNGDGERFWNIDGDGEAECSEQSDGRDIGPRRAKQKDSH